MNPPIQIRVNVGSLHHHFQDSPDFQLYYFVG